MPGTILPTPIETVNMTNMINKGEKKLNSTWIVLESPRPTGSGWTISRSRWYTTRVIWWWWWSVYSQQKSVEVSRKSVEQKSLFHICQLTNTNTKLRNKCELSRAIKGKEDSNSTCASSVFKIIAIIPSSQSQSLPRAPLSLSLTWMCCNLLI